jgi:hypothetical protein
VLVVTGCWHFVGRIVFGPRWRFLGQHATIGTMP